MPSIVLYLLKCSISLAIIWCLYQLLLRRLTFYTMNRWYLLGYAILSFLLPLIHIVLPAEEAISGKVRVISYIPAITAVQTATAAPVFTGWNLLLYLVALGSLVLTGRLLMRWMSLRSIRKEATLVRDAAVAVYQVDKPIIPFSFGNAIYVNARLHTEKEWDEIILHEYVHVRQKHTVDIILAELLCIACWFNPFSWLIRHAIRQNLEFIADQQVLASGLDRKSYQYHLLKVIGAPCYRLANNFNFSSLKKRIIMMNRSKSTHLHLLKFLFIVPMLGVLLLAFRDKVAMHVHRQATVSKLDTTPVKNYLSKITLQQKDTKPMIVIDEVEAEEGLSKVNQADIASVNVLKAAGAFGPRGKNGVVLVYTKNYVKKGEVRLKDGKRVPVQMEAGADGGRAKTRDTLQLVTVESRSVDSIFAQCLIFVDGVETSYEEMRKLDQNSIASIEVLKGESGRALHGEKGRNGVVNIKTKSEGYKGAVSMVIVGMKDTMIFTADSVHYKFPAAGKPEDHRH
ncbi:M56 family metallopeptidase [Flavitalea sp. BT771]|uniref:M56 family metallopeptidase n=1 Tax=Flavitalea sp. BT771 TaxID=3063329 RepID=UPI0026E34486|nr:M56 family metallopeptidase [Flavitalea sp. BT771]MDO6429802.1 M56 family metallopeptidase [Flavitalea sp. BT771]MDV6218070.1 M56 family metallopeptidase [Flavitalea sp. BT771]